jgi:hypothetical protein
MANHEAPNGPLSGQSVDNTSTDASGSGRSVEGPYRDFREALEARRRALRRQRDEALTSAAEAEGALRELDGLDREIGPRRRGNRWLLGATALIAIAAPTFAAGYVVAGPPLTMGHPVGDPAEASVAAPRPTAHAVPKWAGPSVPAPAPLDYGRMAHTMGTPPDDEETARHIRAIDARTWEIDESFVDQLLDGQPLLQRQVRIIPHEERGQIVGVRLFGVRPDSVLAALGFQNGDLLRQVDGLDISTPDAALSAYSRLRRRYVHVIELERRGSRRFHVVRIARHR